MTENLLGIALAVLLWTCTGSWSQYESKQEQKQQQQSSAQQEILGDITISENQTGSIHEHQIWDDLLKKYVSSTGQVDYKNIRNHRAILDQYLKQLKQNPVQDSWTKPQQLAYWINAYNAFTVDLIIRNYPLKSIMDMEKPWDQKFIQLGDRSYSLNEIEHEIVRPSFNDARVHFAFVCAAVSCPKLLNIAYLPQKLDQQLDAQTRYFLNTSGKNQLSPNLVKVSHLFDWYAEDFTSQGTLIEFLNKYSSQEISAGAKVEFLEYDWELNE